MYTAAVLINRVEKTFGDVRLGDGVSIREAFVIDNYGTSEERAAARSKDELLDWHKLIDSNLLCGQALCFMDDAGIRFHLPACFVTVLLEQSKNFHEMYCALLFHLSGAGSVNFFTFSREQIRLMLDIMVWLRVKTDKHLLEESRQCIENLSSEL